MAGRDLIVEVVAAKDLNKDLKKDLNVLRHLGLRTTVCCGLEYNRQRKTCETNKANLSWNEKFDFVINDTGVLGDLEITIQYKGTGKVTIPIDIVTVPYHRRPKFITWWPVQKQGLFGLEGKLGLRMWWQTAEQSSLDKQPYGLYDLDEPVNSTNTLESIESEIEDLKNKRMVAKAAYLKKVIDLVNANHSLAVEAFESSFDIERCIQDTSPLCGSQLVEQSLQRTQSMLATKQTLEKFHIPMHLIPSIDDAMDNERQLVMSVTKTTRDAEEQQKQLRDMEQNAYQAYLDIIEKQNQERMELIKAFKQEKEQHLNLWAASRRDILDIVKIIDSISQPLVEQLNSLLQTTKKHGRKWEAEVLRIFGGAALKETISNPRKSECQICFDCIEGRSSGTSETHNLKQRSCFIPCQHAKICLPCATEIWKTTRKCPFCKEILTAEPRALHLD